MGRAIFPAPTNVYLTKGQTQSVPTETSYPKPGTPGFFCYCASRAASENANSCEQQLVRFRSWGSCWGLSATASRVGAIMRLGALAIVKGGVLFLFLPARGTRGLLSGCTTTMQFARPRTVERRLLPASNPGSNQNAAGGWSTAEETTASSSAAERGGGGIATRGSGSGSDKASRRAQTTEEEGAWAAAVVSGGGARAHTGSAKESLRHVRGGKQARRGAVGATWLFAA